MNKQVVAIGVAIAIVASLLVYKTYAVKNNAPVAQAWQHLAASNGTHVLTTLTLALPHTNGQISNQPIVNVGIKTEGDLLWKEKPKYAGTFKIDTSGRGMQLFTDGQIHIAPEKTFFKLDNLPTLIDPRGNLLGKWTGTDITLLRVTNPEELFPALDSLFTNWVKTKDGTYEKTITADEAKLLASKFQLQSSGSQAFNIAARLLKTFTVDKATATLDNEKNLHELTFHFVYTEKSEQQATLAFTFSEQGKDNSVETPTAESNVQPEIFTKLFGEPLPTQAQ